VNMFDYGKTRMIWLPYGEKNCDDYVKPYYLIPERIGQTDGRTDRQTERQICYINIARQYADAIKRVIADICRSYSNPRPA